MKKYQVKTTQQYGDAWTWELWDERGEIIYDADLTPHRWESDAILAAKVAALNLAHSGTVNVHTIEVEQ